LFDANIFFSLFFILQVLLRPNPFYDVAVSAPIMEIPPDVEGLIYTR